MQQYKIGGATSLPLEQWMEQEPSSCTYENYLNNPNYEPKISREEFNKKKELIEQKKIRQMRLQQEEERRQQQDFKKWIYDSYQRGHTYEEYMANPQNPRMRETEFNEIVNNPMNALGSPPRLVRQGHGGKSKKYKKRSYKKYKKRSYKKYKKRSYKKH